MYKIIGADGKEYGPITSEQLRQWIAEGRVNAQTKILAEGTTEWRAVSEFPEFAAASPGTPPPPSGTPGPIPTIQPASIPVAGDAAAKVSGPAIALIVVAAIALALGLVNGILTMAGVAVFPRPSSGGPPPEMMKLFQGLGGIVGIVLVLAIYGTMLLGAIKMKKLESYGLAMTASILALLPCSLCCIIGLPIGIWSLVVLSKPEVKSAFH
jgi:hypothetical protein